MRLPRFSRRRAPLGLLLVLIVVGCPYQPGEKLSREELAPITHARLERFESSDAFDDYMDRVSELRNRANGGGGGLFGCAGNDAAEGPPSEDPSSEDESITNNQEEGVDEGGIVKAVDDYFVILRRGRLFTMRQGMGAEALMPVHQVDAHAPGFTQGTWYDEMLVYDRRIIVIGYSYEVSATELVLFRLGDDGRLTYEASHFLRSNDYYSSRNYTGRLVGSTLIFYIPHMLNHEDDLPAVGHWRRSNDTSGWSKILSKVDVYRPVQPAIYPMLHTVVRCELDSPEFTCSARAVMGPASRTFYVARDAVYVWVSGSSENWYLKQEEQDPKHPDAYVYRLPLDGGEPTALRARGSPIDQFSFRESADGHLEVLLTGQGFGDAMWGPEITQGTGEFALLRAPLSSFSTEAVPAAGANYTRLPGPTGYALQNRFVGNHVLWGAGGGWSGAAGTEQHVWVTDVRSPQTVRQVELGHGVDRLEALGSNGAMVVGSDGISLRFTALALGETPQVRGKYARLGATQGETRSHGFFFKPDGTGGGVLGLPVRLEGAPWMHLRYGSAEVTFLRVEQGLELRPLGSLVASEETRDDACTKSCTDWYGNARPIFYKGRVFALMGYELVEAQVGQDSLQESFRASFLDAQR